MQQLHIEKFNHYILLTLSILVLSFSPMSFAQDQNPTIAWGKINNGALILDVRTAEEFAAGHLKGAVNIPFEIALTELNKQKMSKDTDIVLYCRSGNRSGKANSELVAAGYTNTYNGGGYQMLSANKH